MLADQMLNKLAECDDGGVLMLAATEAGCGAYGRLIFDPWSSIEVRMFGWPRLTPGHADEDTASVAAMLRLGFVYDGTDWVWERPFLAALLPVAAHAAGRALAEAWTVTDGDWTECLFAFHLLPREHVIEIADGKRCERCADSCAQVHDGDQ